MGDHGSLFVRERGRMFIKEIAWIGAKRRRVQGQCPCRVWAEPSVTRARSAHKNKTLHACFFRARWLPQSRLRRSSSLPEGASSYTNDSRISMAYL